MKCIILAGGSGERLWPLSRASNSKVLLNLCGDKTLLQSAFELALSLTGEKNILTVTNVKQETDVRLELKKSAKSPVILSEPMAKNTTAAIASAITFLKKKKDEVVVIMPSDFYIKDKSKFNEAIDNAKNIAKDGYIVAIGVKPQYAEENFGYILSGDKLKKGFSVQKFIEKPDKTNAEKFLKNSKMFWNTGIYVAKLSVLEKAIQDFAPESINGFSLEMFDEVNKINFKYYENLPEISIDYSVMEKIENLAFVELKSKWIDIGSWISMYNYGTKDEDDNVIKGNVITDKVKNSFIYSTKELVAVSNVKDKIVIETEDALLVSDKNKIDSLRTIVKTLKNAKSKTTQAHKTVFRPWGYYTCLNGGKGWLSKIITVLPGHKLSLQSHEHRSEHWVVLEGCATVILNEETHELTKSQSIDIPVKEKHSLQNKSKDVLKILEVQKGDYISENDIIRYEDIYGRV